MRDTPTNPSDSPRPDPNTITRLLAAWRTGDQDALDELMERIYNNLRGMAANHLRRERPEHTLATGDLVHQTFLQLIEQNQVLWQDRIHFFAICARVMRRILVDHARRRDADKRGGGLADLPLDVLSDSDLVGSRHPDLIALDDALQALVETDPQAAQAIELSYFGGFTTEEISIVLDISIATVGRRLRLAKADLHRQLASHEPDDD